MMICFQTLLSTSTCAATPWSNTAIGAVERPEHPHRAGEFALTPQEWPLGRAF
jgi:hypothetical protein